MATLTSNQPKPTHLNHGKVIRTSPAIRRLQSNFTADANHNNEVGETIAIMKKNIRSCIDDGVARYKNLMDSLLEFKTPLKESQLREFHSQNLDVIQGALVESYDDILTATTDPYIKKQYQNLLSQARNTVEALVNAQFNEIYLRKNEIQMEGVSKKVKELTDRAEGIYNEQTGSLLSSGKDKQEVISSHKQLAEDTVEKFGELLQANHIENQEFWNSELNNRLKEHLEDLQEDFQLIDENESKSVEDIDATKAPTDDAEHADKEPVASTPSDQTFTVAAEMFQSHDYNTVYGQRSRSPSPDEVQPSTTMQEQKMQRSSKPIHSVQSQPFRSRGSNQITPKKQAFLPVSPPPIPLWQPIKVKSPTLQPSATKIITYSARPVTGQRKPTSPDSVSTVLDHSASNLNSSITSQTDEKQLHQSFSFDVVGDTVKEKKLNTFVNTEDDDLASPLSAIKPASNKKIDIGIYLDENLLQVGTYQCSTTTSKTFKELVSISPEIYFSDNEVLVGDEALHYSRKNDGRYFNIFHLVTSFKPMPLRDFLVNESQHTLCIHEIIAAFLRKVLSTVEQAKGVNIEKIVVTIPFTPSSAAKERISRAGKIAGFPVSRILSTLITTAIATLEETDYYSLTRNPESPPNCVFVVDYQINSFSMAMVEMSSTSIVTFNPYGSDNMMECQEERFLEAHTRLYNGGNALPPAERRILQVYEKAINRVFDNMKNIWIDGIAVSSRSKFDNINKVVLGILNKNGIQPKTSLLGRPLLGASLLASSPATPASELDVKYLLPPEIQVHDSSRSDLFFSKQRKRKTLSRVHFMGKQLHRGSAFNSSFLVHLKGNSQETISVALNEYFGHISIFDVCRYQLTLRSHYPRNQQESEDTKCKIHVRCVMNDDGVFELQANVSPGIPVELQMLRTDDLTCNSACANSEFSEYSQLLRDYEHLELY